MREGDGLTRRAFLAVTAGAAAGCASVSRAKVTRLASARVVGANETIQVGVIGCGSRGTYLMKDLIARGERGDKVVVAAVCDIYEPRKQRAKDASSARLYHHWEDVVSRRDLDAVVIATPDHWHAPIAIAAMQAGKDVYCEKPMSHTVEEAKAFRDGAAETGRIVQIGTQDASDGQWYTAGEIIRAGHIGRVLWSQAGYSRNSKGGEWNSPIPAEATLKTLDWERFLGSAEKRAFTRERFFRWRKYWDYSGGIATDLFYHKLAPLLIAIGPEFPERVSAAGGVYVQDDREVPDTFVMTLEYPSGHTIVLASSMANRQGLPGVIRGREASLYCEGAAVRVVAEDEFKGEFAQRFGVEAEKAIPVQTRPDHVANWLDGIRTRTKCACDEELGYRTMVGIAMGVEAYRRGKTLSWDATGQTIMVSPPRALHAHEGETV
ncbi:MAG: Gfo/Idh/MocA family oxidoreductase [Candidatus Hydrogenedentes bacterium]|nr:Gfo/Idh/MocA family oxidoreductase [Candidatus Hydrogenedentota bacterium]